MATVLKIPAKFHPITHLPEIKVQKRRVAAYARVSTDSEEQQTSYAAQVDCYTKYIQERADWEFVAVYTDESISALNTNIGTALIAWWQMLWTARSI
ncbi:MAG: recombinase family protein [Ruminococcus sp.]